MEEDKLLINISFLKEYGIRLEDTNNDDLDSAEFLEDLYGLLCIDCPFGNIVRIRSTPSTEFSQLSKNEKETWLDWRKKHPECVQHTRKLTLKDLYGDEDEE